jgi:hypothetical protein
MMAMRTLSEMFYRLGKPRASRVARTIESCPASRALTRPLPPVRLARFSVFPFGYPNGMD